MFKQLGWLFIAIALILQTIGGLMDIYKKDELRVSKEHIFADALFILVLGLGFILMDLRGK